MKKYIIFTSILVVSFFGGINQGFAQGPNNSSSPKTTTTTTTTTSTNNTTGYENISDIPGFENYEDPFANNNIENISPYKDQETANQAHAANEKAKELKERIQETTKNVEEVTKAADKAAADRKTKSENEKVLAEGSKATTSEKLAAKQALAESSTEKQKVDNTAKELSKAEKNLENTKNEQQSLKDQIAENEKQQGANLFDSEARELLEKENAELQNKMKEAEEEVLKAQGEYDKAKVNSDSASADYEKEYEKDINDLKSMAKAEHEKACDTGAKAGKCLEQPTFVISMKETIGVGFEVEGNTSQVINRTLGTIIQKLMVALGVLSVLIMTVGAGYIIMYHGQDELLSKGKSIFMSGITALIVALSSYYIVSILRFILYN